MILFDKVKALVIGHLTVFKHTFKKRVTLEYPEVKSILPKNFRGIPKWVPNKCIACKICMKVCPSGAINIEKLPDKIVYKLDLSKCIICGNCAYNCPKEALSMSKVYETATDDKKQLVIEMSSEEPDNE